MSEYLKKRARGLRPVPLPAKAPKERKFRVTIALDEVVVSWMVSGVPRDKSRYIRSHRLLYRDFTDLSKAKDICLELIGILKKRHKEEAMKL